MLINSNTVKLRTFIHLKTGKVVEKASYKMGGDICNAYNKRKASRMHKNTPIYKWVRKRPITQ